MSKHKLITAHRQANAHDIKRSGMLDVNAIVESRSPAINTVPHNDWSILFDALGAFEPGINLVREQPAS